jgi:hypothetical protein
MGYRIIAITNGRIGRETFPNSRRIVPAGLSREEAEEKMRNRRERFAHPKPQFSPTPQEMQVTGTDGEFAVTTKTGGMDYTEIFRIEEES